MGRGGSFVPMARNDIDLTGANNWTPPLGPILPFDVKFETPTSFELIPGIIAGILPSNMFTSFAYSNTDVYVWATCTSSSGVVTNVRLNDGSSLPDPQEVNEGFPPFTFNIPVCMVRGFSRKTFNFIGANWLTPYPVLAYSTQNSAGAARNFYVWRW
jgi:hypothetical protein